MRPLTRIIECSFYSSNFIYPKSNRRARLTSVDFEQNAVIEYKKKLKSKYDKQMKLFKFVNKTDNNEFSYFFKNDQTRY